MIKFEITDKQEEKLRNWKEAIKTEYGSFVFSFKPNGIGDSVEVYSELAEATLDLTDVDPW